MQQLQQKKREGNSLQQQIINLQSRFRVGQKQLREPSREKVDQESSLQQQIVCLKSTLMAKDSQLELHSCICTGAVVRTMYTSYMCN